MKYLINTETDPFYNMAFDEYVFKHISSNDKLFYLWRNRPSIIVGVNQNVYKEVNLHLAKERGVEIVRRSTGGGAVYHDLGNVNFTFIGSHSDESFFINKIIVALKHMGVEAEKNGRNDIISDGKKISGMAKLQYGDKLLLHGTLLFDVDFNQMNELLTPNNDKLISKGIRSVNSRVGNIKDKCSYSDVYLFIDNLQRLLADCDDRQDILIDKAEIRKIASEKYQDVNWTYQKIATFNKIIDERLACGQVIIHMDVQNGIIANIRFEGDFLGNKAIGGIENRLIGKAYEEKYLESLFKGISVCEYMDNVTNLDFIKLLFRS